MNEITHPVLKKSLEELSAILGGYTKQEQPVADMPRSSVVVTDEEMAMLTGKKVNP